MYCERELEAWTTKARDWPAPGRMQGVIVTYGVFYPAKVNCVRDLPSPGRRLYWAGTLLLDAILDWNAILGAIQERYTGRYTERYAVCTHGTEFTTMNAE